jgi:hypothetical protein
MNTSYFHEIPLLRAEPHTSRLHVHPFITRFLILLTCISGLSWAYCVGFASLHVQSARKFSLRILEGHTYTVSQLDYQIHRFLILKGPQITCQGDLERSLAVMALNRYEHSERSESFLLKTRAQVHAALACHPGDGYLWLAEAWLRTQTHSAPSLLSQSPVTALALSFQFAPREGWIVRRRLPLSLALFDQLPPALQEKTIQDFANLVEYFYFTEAIEAVTTIDKIIAQRLLEGLGSVPYERMRIFSRMLQKVDPFLSIPGFSHGTRPWQM